MWLYRIIAFVFRGFTRLMGVRFTGKQNVPAEGAVVVIGNHRHWSDIVLMALAVYPRQVHFMAKSEYSQNRFFNFIIHYLGSFTVERGEADIRAIKTALGYLKQGEVVGIFPEGTRNKTDKLLLDFKPGAFVLASRGKAQVLPLAIYNAPNYASLRKPRTAVQVGEPFSLADFLDEKKKFAPQPAADFALATVEKMLKDVE